MAPPKGKPTVHEPNPNISPLAISKFAAHNPKLMADGHGHVIPRPDGSQAPCGGPSVCRMCHLEFLACQTTDRITVMEGWKLSPGDKLLLLAPTNMPEGAIAEYGRVLKERFPEVDITIMKGFTGVQVFRNEPSQGLANS